MKPKQKNRNAAILAAYASGGYSYQQIADHFSVHFTTVGRIVGGVGLMINYRPDSGISIWLRSNCRSPKFSDSAIGSLDIAQCAKGKN